MLSHFFENTRFHGHRLWHRIGRMLPASPSGPKVDSIAGNKPIAKNVAAEISNKMNAFSEICTYYDPLNAMDKLNQFDVERTVKDQRTARNTQTSSEITSDTLISPESSDSEATRCFH